MEIMFIAIMLLAFAHFIYEGIVAPSLRMQCRNDLFTLRDDLRAQKIAKGKDFPDEAFSILHEGINRYLGKGALAGVNLRFLYRFAHAARKPNSQFRADIERRKSVIEGAADPEVKDILRRAGSIVERAFFINTAAWAIYIVPIAIAVACISSATRLLMRVVAAPPEGTGRLMDQSLELAA